jgi:hypothetical protein
MVAGEAAGWADGAGCATSVGATARNNSNRTAIPGAMRTWYSRESAECENKGGGYKPPVLWAGDLEIAPPWQKHQIILAG